MAIAIYEDLNGRRYWAESTSTTTARNLEAGDWVLVDDTPTTPPPAGDPLDREMAERVPGSGPFAVALRAALVAFDVTGPVGGTQDATSAFVAAATAAQDEGRDSIRVRPGLYHCPGMTAADMGGVYILGDGVTFTPTSYVAAFSQTEWAQRGRHAGDTGSQNGVIAFECDDATAQQWQYLFPLTKRLGIGIGVAWPTAWDRPWIPEVHRHGWEILAHGANHLAFATLTDAQIEAEASTSHAAVAAITGDAENVAMVYPEHSRTDNSDRICSKYFTRGRGAALISPTVNGGGHRWLTSAMFCDPEWSGGVMSGNLKNVLRAIARGNGRKVFYFHFADGNRVAQSAAFEETVAFARSLGIRIDLPSRVLGGRRVTPDPYFDDPAAWNILEPASVSFSTDRSYKGANSIKYTAGSATITNSRFHTKQFQPAPAQAGRFAVYRASWRYECDSDVTVSSGWGWNLHLSLYRRSLTTESVSLGAPRPVGKKFPESGTTIPASTFANGRVARPVIIGPDITEITPFLYLNNLGALQPPLYVDEFKMEYLDSVSALTFTATLNGTTGVPIYTGVVEVGNYGIALAAAAATAGRLHYATTGDKITVFSTDPADTTQTVKVTVTPTASYADYAFPATGA